MNVFNDGVQSSLPYYKLYIWNSYLTSVIYKIPAMYTSFKNVINGEHNVYLYTWSPPFCLWFVLLIVFVMCCVWFLLIEFYFVLSLFCELPFLVYSIQHYVIKFVSDLRQVYGLLRVLRFPPPIKLTATIWLKYFWKRL